VIELVTLDLYQTLCYGEPGRNERLARVLGEMGYACTADQFLRPNVLAEELYAVENGREAVHLRSPEEQDRFYAGMFALMLREAGLRHDPDLALGVRRAMVRLQREVPSQYRLYEDVRPAIAALRERGVKLGVVSNTSRDATVLCTELGVCDLVDFVVSSCLVGCEKPGRRIFESALELAGVEPGRAVHVGDQPRSDALGATMIGMHALLLDRDDLLAEEEYTRVRSLVEVVDWVDVAVPTPA
jgi:HAD superfamily hydrolase (TIGR01549 family)